MIDIHSHILPGIDDGARDIGQSLEMAHKYVMAGYTRVIATPHAVPEDRGVRFARSIDLHVANLNRTQSVRARIALGDLTAKSGAAYEIAVPSDAPDGRRPAGPVGSQRESGSGQPGNRPPGQWLSPDERSDR